MMKTRESNHGLEVIVSDPVGRQDEKEPEEKEPEEVTTGRVIHMSEDQEDVVTILRDLADGAERGDVVAFVLTCVHHDGTSTYSKAGKIAYVSEALQVIGALEHLKSEVMDDVKEYLEDD